MEVVYATREHALNFLREPIRQVDIDEWVLMGQCSVDKSLLEVVGRPGVMSRALINDDGLAICLWGVDACFDPEGKPIGGVWLIASREAEKRGREIHRYWRHEVSLMHLHAGRKLVCVVYERNGLHLHWLSVLGFERTGTVIAPPNIRLGTYTRIDEECADHSPLAC